MNEVEGSLDQLVSVRLMEFLDRTIEAERRATAAGFERFDAQ